MRTEQHLDLKEKDEKLIKYLSNAVSEHRRLRIQRELASIVTYLIKVRTRKSDS